MLLIKAILKIKSMSKINYVEGAKAPKEFVTVGSAWTKHNEAGEIRVVSIAIGNQMKDKKSGERVETVEEITLKAGDSLMLVPNQYKKEDNHPDFRVRMAKD